MDAPRFSEPPSFVHGDRLRRLCHKLILALPRFAVDINASQLNECC